MSDKDNNPTGSGNELMKAIGALTDVVDETEKSKDEDETTSEEVGNWLAIIGKVILSILK